MEHECLNVCPSCGAYDLVPYIESNGHKIVKCCGCELLFVNPRPTEDAIKQMFVEEYIGTNERVDEHFTMWRQASLKREANCLKKLLPDGGQLLDLGTASGAFLGEFAGLENWKVEGVEPSRFAATAAAERYKVSVSHGFLRDQDFAASSFDVISSLDAVMFHPDPRSDLGEIVRILKPGGLLVIEIPGLRFRLLKNSGLLCQLIYRKSAQLNAGVHLFYYSRVTLRRLVTQFGFKEVVTYPEQSPVRGSWFAKVGNWSYYLLSGALYRITSGWFNVAPKEFIVFKKVGLNEC